MTFSLIGLALLLLICGCEKRHDPFAAPPIGMKVELRPLAEESRSDHAAAGKEEIVLIRLLSLGISPSAVREQVAAISFTTAGKAAADKFSLQELALTKEGAYCPDPGPDVAGLMQDFPGMILICRDDVAEALRRASRVSIQFKSGGVKSLTSWGVLNTDSTGEKILIHSFSI
jgi:hypothetical protein